MAEMDFLTFPISSIRRSIKDIDDSYRNSWDIYAELTQNAVDAIRKMQAVCDEKGAIELTINARDKSIIIKDNGCGISADDIPNLLKLFSSGKWDDKSTVGEKGVGLKFAYFQSTFFEIISCDGATGGRAIIKDALFWKQQTTDDMLKLDFEEISAEDIEKSIGLKRGTKITLKGVNISGDEDGSENSIFKLKFEQLKYVLRSATYLGNTSTIWEDDPNPIGIVLSYTDYSGEEHRETLENRFFLPTEIYDDKDIVDIDEFEKWLKEKDRSDVEKRNKLQNKILVLKGTYQYKGYRKIQYWVCFLPTRRNWDTINEKNHLFEDITDEKELQKWKQDNSYCIFTPGIYTATKGMPTGITVDQPTTGFSGYWPNFFMIFEDDLLSFDIGRKSIHGKIQTIYQTKAKEIFGRIVPYVTNYTSAIPLPSPISTTFDRDAIRDYIKNLVPLESSIVAFEKNPAEQEASVAAVFYELIGNKTIKDIVPIYSGYRHQYDLYAYYINASGKKEFKIIEFKSHLRNITKDFPDATKVFAEMDYIVCWDVNDTDIQALFDFGITCEEKSKSELNPENFSGSVSHVLLAPNINPVYVIDLKKLVKKA
ncbi:MAG: ATP-binding protein [Oscillospiraceae bacterium]|nr:ATP-binding protein [Oscillospiraceae bacterium]